MLFNWVRSDAPPPRLTVQPPPADPPAEDDTLQARERAHILQVCQATGWKIKGPDGAARRLGLNPGTLYARMKKLGIRRPAVGG